MIEPQNQETQEKIYPLCLCAFVLKKIIMRPLVNFIIIGFDFKKLFCEVNLIAKKQK